MCKTKIANPDVPSVAGSDVVAPFNLFNGQQSNILDKSTSDVASGSDDIQKPKISKIENDAFDREVPYPKEISLIRSGHVLEVRLSDKLSSRGAKIKKLSDDEYAVLDTGEIREYIKSNSDDQDNFLGNRSADPRSIKRSQVNLRRLINANTTRSELCKWVTLTYDQSKFGIIRDFAIVTADFQAFNRSLRDYCFQNNLGCYEYIVVFEPQRSGCWHLHVIQIWPDSFERAPLVPKEAYWAAWNSAFRHGDEFAKTQLGGVDLKACVSADNLGAYLSAYLGDAEIPSGEPLPGNSKIKEVDLINPETGKTEHKKFVKGARLHFYPVGMQLYRASRGVKRPEEFTLTFEAWQKLSKELATTLEEPFRTSSSLTVGTFERKLSYLQYNTKRKK